MVAGLIHAATYSSGGSLATVGPLGGDSDASAVCVHLAPTAVAVLGVRVLANTASHSAVIESVSVRQVQNVRVVAQEFVPVLGRSAFGVETNYPPSARQLEEMPGVDWAHRVRAVGASLPPGGSIPTQAGVYDLVVAVARTGHSDGSISGVDVTYRVGPHRYLLQSSTALILYSGNCFAPNAPTAAPYPSG